MDDLKKGIFDIDGLIRKLNALVTDLDELNFAYGSAKLEQLVHEALSESTYKYGSISSLEKIVEHCEKFDTWTTLSARWKAILDQVEKFLIIEFEPDKTKTKESKNEEEQKEDTEESEITESEDEGEEEDED